MNNIPFYAGRTNSPEARYKAHYYWRDCKTYNLVRHKLVMEGIYMEMKVVYCSPDNEVIKYLEAVAIRALYGNGFIIYNSFIASSKTSELIIYPNIDRLPHKLLNEAAIKHVIESKKEILKEYGY